MALWATQLVTREVSTESFRVTNSLRCSISKHTEGLLNNDLLRLQGVGPLGYVKVSHEVQSKEWSDQVTSTILLAQKRGTTAGFVKKIEKNLE